MTVLHNVRIPDLDSPTSAAAPVDVEFTDTITAVRPAADPDPSSAPTLLPGLIDTHVHLGERSRLVDALQSGLTTVVDLGTHPDSLVAGLRADCGLPFILSAGTAASAPGSTQIAAMGFPAESGVTGPGDAERFLAWRVDNGVDLIKIIIEDPDAADVPALDILTHIPFDHPQPEETIGRIVETGTVVSPTLVMMRAIADARLGDHADAAFAIALSNVRALHDAGVRIIAGTDANETPFAPVHHGPSLHDEFGYLIEAGMTSAEAVRSATSAAADALGLADRGRIVEGARADLLLVEASPVDDIEVLRTPAEVWVGGVRISASQVTD